jgi:hypothetical protein
MEHVAYMGERKGAYSVLVGRPESKRHRWDNNIKMELQRVGWGGMDWIDVAQDGYKWQAVLNVAMILRVP